MFTFFVVALLQSPLFDFDGTEPSARIIAAALALVGVLFAAVASVIGVVLKHSLDQRSADLREQAESRLRLEAGIEALKLLGGGSGNRVSPAQQSGVLLALAHLKMTRLALTLMKQMLEQTDGSIDSTTLDWVLNLALESGDTDAQSEAVSLLERHAEGVLCTNTEGGRFPDCLTEGRVRLPDDCRAQVASAAIKQILAFPAVTDQRTVSAALTALTGMWAVERDKSLKSGIGLCLAPILSTFPQGTYYRAFGINVGVDDVKETLSSLSAHDDNWGLYGDFGERLKEWARTRS